MMKQRGPLEVSVFIISLLLILGTLSLFIYDSIKSKQPALIKVTFQKEQTVRTRLGDYRMPVTLENIGDESAQDVLVEVKIEPLQGESETAELLLPFVPEGSLRRAAIVLDNDPSRARIEARIKSYIIP